MTLEKPIRRKKPTTVKVASAPEPTLTTLSVYAVVATEQGLLVVGASTGDFPHSATLQAFDAEEATPIELGNAAHGAILRTDLPPDLRPAATEITHNAVGRYVLWLPGFAAFTNQQMSLELMCASGAKLAYFIRPVPYGTLSIQRFQDLNTRFAPLLNEVICLALPPEHGLRRIDALLVQMTRQATIAGLPETPSAPQAINPQLAQMVKPVEVVTLPTQPKVDHETDPDDIAAITGHFDLVSNDRAQGWAWNPLNLKQRLFINILHDKQIIASGIANQFRKDLAVAGMGDGKYHFQIKLPLSLRNGVLRTLTAGIAGTEVLLNGSHEYQSSGLTIMQLDLICPAEVRRMAQSLQDKVDPDSDALLLRALQANQLLDIEETDDARSQFQSLIDEYGIAALWLCKIGEADLLCGDTGAALMAYRRAVEIDPGCADAALGLGSCHLRQRSWRKAGDAFQAGLAHNPDHPTLLLRWEAVRIKACIEHAGQLQNDGDITAALALYRDQLMLTPDDADIVRHLGQLLMTRQHEVLQPINGPKLASFVHDQSLFDFMLEEAELMLERRAG